MNEEEECLSNKQMLDTLMKAIVDIKEEGKLNKEELKKEIKADIQLVINKLEDNSSKIKVLTAKLNDLESKCINADRGRRKNNILIYGLEVPKSEDLLNYTLNKFRVLLEIDVQESDINNIYRLNKAKHPTIKVEFVTFLKKNLVCKNARKLKGTNIFIGQDLCPEDRDDHKILTENLKVARSKNYLAKIKGKTLQINGETYTIKQLKELEKAQETHEIIKDPSSPITTYNKSNSAPPTPSPSVFEIEADCYFNIDQDISEQTAYSLLKEDQVDRKKKATTEKKANLTQFGKKKAEEGKVIQKPNSISSEKSDVSNRQLRNKNKV